MCPKTHPRDCLGPTLVTGVRAVLVRLQNTAEAAQQRRQLAVNT
jgi:hypothetical protein